MKTVFVLMFLTSCSQLSMFNKVSYCYYGYKYVVVGGESKIDRDHNGQPRRCRE